MRGPGDRSHRRSRPLACVMSTSWSNFTSGIAGALIGAIIGAVATFLAARMQTTRVIEAEAQANRERAEQERDAARLARSHAAAAQILDVLAALWRALAPLTPRAVEDRYVMYDLATSRMTVLPLVTDPRCRDRFHRLHGLVQRHGEVQRRLPDELKSRAYEDLEAYLGYVQRTFAAHIQGADLPPDAPPPVTHDPERRERWKAPDEEIR